MRRQLLPKAGSETSMSPTGMHSIPLIGGGEGKQIKRRCISSACMPCRKRKSKCDGDKPSCTACRDVYTSKCHYDLDADHRRKGALKRDISQLTTKVTSIGAVLDAIRAGSEADVDDIVHLIRSNPDQSHENMAEMIQSMTLNKQADPPSIEPPSSLEGQLLMDFHGKAASVDNSGGTRHYGHTSNFALQYEDDQRAMSAEQVETWTNVTTDTGLINDILNSYFSWVHPFYLLFSEEIFHHGMRDKKAKYCTPLLVNAILAMGCHYSDRPECSPTNPDPIGDRFFVEAKRLLAEDDNTPALTIVQALALMSVREAMNSHDSSGRRYAAQMMSMVVELGLHISHSGSKLTLYEIEARRVTFWGCFVLEQVWSVCVGRVPTLPRTAIRLDKPILTSRLENTLWVPHGFSEQDIEKFTQPSHKYTLLWQSSVLVEIVDDILRSFYAPRDRVTSRKLQMFHERLQDWYMNLPVGLSIRSDGPTTPQVLTLHIFYHNCVLQTFRPFLKVSFVQASESPLKICTSSANTISQLLDLYKSTYGIRKSFFVNTHCIMSAAIIHLVNISSHPGTVDPQTEHYLAEAIRIMYEMMRESTIVGRYLKIIKGMILSWCKEIPPKVKKAMDEINIDNLGSPQFPGTTSPGSPSITNTNTISTNGNNTNGNTNIFQPTLLTRKPSAPEVLQMVPPQSSSHSSLQPSLQHPFHIPNNNNNNNAQLPPESYQNLFWTPYPESFEGIPLTLPCQQDNGMDITNVLDSGVSGDWPSWNRDGFTTGVGMGMGTGEEGVRGIVGGGSGNGNLSFLPWWGG